MLCCGLADCHGAVAKSQIKSNMKKINNEEMLVTLLAEVRAMSAQINDLGQVKNQNEEC